MWHGEYGEPSVLFRASVGMVGYLDIGDEIPVAEHDPFRAACRPRSVDYRGEVIRKRTYDAAVAGVGRVIPLDDFELLYVDDKHHPVPAFLTDFRQKPLRHEDRLAAGVGQYVRYFGRGGVRQYRHGDASERDKREHCHRPVGHVLGEDGHPVSGSYPVPAESCRYLIAFFPETSVGISHVRTEHSGHPVVFV